MMVEEQDSSIITGLEGHDRLYSLSEFAEYLKAALSSEKHAYGWVFWRARHHDSNSSTSYKTEIKEKIKSLLIAPGWGYHSLVQFWAPKVDGRHHYLTTSDQPFSLGSLCKGLCWYRKLCMDHYYVVEEGAKEDQLGAVGRVYRNKHPDSTPDLRLYSAKEFPLRDFAARYGLRKYIAVPVFDLHNNECYGVLEVLSFDTAIMEDQFLTLDQRLQVAELRTTHIHFLPLSRDQELMPQPPKYRQQHESEISNMLELAIKAVPQLHLAQVWFPCKQCAKMSSNLSCMERATFITSEDERVNSCKYIDTAMFDFLQACEFHNLQIEKGIGKALMSSKSKSFFCRNFCDISISENPISHHAQKARLSLCFAVCLESVHNSNDLYVVEFFLQSNGRDDASGESFRHLLSRIMEKELKSYKFALGGQLVEELPVGLSLPNAIDFESTEYVQEMEYQQSEQQFSKYLPTADLFCPRPSGNFMHGWAFCSPDREELSEDEVNTSSSLKDKIKHLMNEIQSRLFWDTHSLAQFWAPEMEEEDRCYLATSDQPYALGCSRAKGLALFRDQCMKHHYFVDEEAKEEEIGPPGRVFRNGHPEITPDLRLYSTTEFSLRNHAAHCGLQSYFALPVFDLYQHTCVGVLEVIKLGDSAEILDVYVKAVFNSLRAANLSSTHGNFMTSFGATYIPSNIAECWKLPLTEVKEAFKLINKIPQLYMAELWVPYRECASNNSNLSCMELALSTKCRREFLWRMSELHHVQTRKGIAGMVLASENKSCFCRNSCDFSITEQPLAHFEQRERLDVCFAICLQSSHTGDLLYILEFFLNQGPATYECLRSFLNFLLPIMKQKLKSFKVASGKQLGQELVIEVIEFSEANKLTFSELDQPDIFPLKFKIVQYGRKEHQHTNDQQVQYVSDANLNIEGAAKKAERGKRKTGLRLNLEDLEPHFGKRLKDVAEELGVGRSTIKRACRDYGIHRWPSNEKIRKNPSLFETETTNESARYSHQNMKNTKRILPSDMPLDQNVPQTNTESTPHLTVQSEAENAIIKVKHEQNAVRFQFCVSSGMEKLLEEVAMRLNLKMGSFNLKYLDEDNDEILLACDADLQLCPKSLTAVGKTCIQLFVQLISK